MPNYFYIQDQGVFVPTNQLAQSFAALNIVEKNSLGIGTDTLKPISNIDNPNWIVDLQTKDFWGFVGSGNSNIYRMTKVGIKTDNPIDDCDIFGTLRATDTVRFTKDEDSTSTSTGALQVTGGVGIGKTLNVGGSVTATSFYGDGSNLTGIVTSIVAGTNITVSGSTGQVTINASSSGGGGSSQWVTTAAGIHTLSNVGIGTINPTTRISIGGTTGISFIDTNIRIGDVSTGSSITSGVHNFFGGNESGKFTTSGSNNNFIGNCAGYANTTGSFNNFFGSYAGCCNTTGFYNNFFGIRAGRNNISGSNNNFFGNSAGYANTTGSFNNFIGPGAGYSNTTGSYNNFFGPDVGRCNTSGSYNNFIGIAAGYCNTTACNNIAIGHQAGTTAYSPSGLINLTTTGDIIVIGNANHTNFYTKMAAKSHGATAVKWCSTTFELAADTSSCRFKTNIRPFLGGVAELLAIESVRYNPIEKSDGPDEVGFIAEQIDEIGLTEFVCYDIEEKPLSVSYDRMAALLVNAIKELDTENTLLKIRLEALETHVGIATNA